MKSYTLSNHGRASQDSVRGALLAEKGTARQKAKKRETKNCSVCEGSFALQNTIYLRAPVTQNVSIFHQIRRP